MQFSQYSHNNEHLLKLWSINYYLTVNLIVFRDAT